MPTENRCYIDPLKCIYFDEDGDIHFDGPRIAKVFDVPMEEAIKVLKKMMEEDGCEVVILDRPKPPRGH